MLPTFINVLLVVTYTLTVGSHLRYCTTIYKNTVIIRSLKNKLTLINKLNVG